MGSGARQSYAADTFPLGLCLFHLLTGYAPYEELLQDVHCPGHLATVLRDIWLTDDVNSPFHLIHQVVISLDMSDGSGFDNAVGEEPENVLLDTLYRYMVLFGLSESFTGDASSCSAYAGSPVWLALFDALDITSLHGRFLHKDTGRMQPQLQRFHPSHARRGRGNSVKDECAMQYLRDVQLWSTHIGNHPTMARYSSSLLLRYSAALMFPFFSFF